MAELFRSILLETKNACTRACWFCKFGQDRQDPEARTMSWELIERIIDNLADLSYAGRISWFWINEPLLDSRMPEILSLTRRRCPNAFLSLMTNGDLLTRDVYARLRQSGLDALGVSVYDDETFARIESIRDRALVKVDMRRSLPGVLENRAGNIRSHATLFAPLARRVSGASCARPFTQMAVMPEGRVALCCSDMYGDVAAGDAKSQRLEEIWEGDIFRRYRAALTERGRKGLALCEGCSYSGEESSSHYPLAEVPKARRLPSAPGRVRSSVDQMR